jgi:hypothetical protein
MLDFDRYLGVPLGPVAVTTSPIAAGVTVLGPKGDVAVAG